MITPPLPWEAAVFLTAGIFLRLPGFRIPLENNGGFFVSRIHERHRGVPGMENRIAPLTDWVLTRLWRLFGARWDYAWVRLPGCLAHGLTAAALYATLASLAGRPEAAWAAALYLLAGSVPHLMPWFTCPEWYALPATTLAFLCAARGSEAGGLPWTLASGALATVAAGFKISALAEVATLGLAAATLAWVRVDPPHALWTLGAFLAAPAAAAAAILAREGDPRALFRWAHDLLNYKRSDRGHRGTTSARGSLRVLARAAAGIAAGWAPLLAALAFAPWTPTPRWALLALLALWAAGGAASLAAQHVWSPGHWVPLLPPVSAAAGICAAGALGAPFPVRIAFAGILAAALAFLAAHARRHPYRAHNYRPWQRIYLDIGRHVRRSTPEGSTLFCWGWHPQIYLFAGRSPVLPQMPYCHHDYLERLSPGWRERLLEAFDKNPPETVVQVNPQFPLMMIQVLAGRTYRKTADVRCERFLGRIYRLTDAPTLAAFPAGLPWADRARALCARLPGLWARREYALLSILGQAVVEWDPANAEAKRWLLRADPNLGAAPVRSLDNPDESLELRRTGDGIAATLTRGTGTLDLTDPAAPLSDARAWAEGCPPDAEAYLVLGLGLGHGLAVLFDRIPAHAPIVVVERDLALYREAWQAHAEAFRLRADRIAWHVSRPVEDVAKALERLDLGRAAVCIEPRAAAVDPAYYASLAEALGERLPPAQAAPSEAIAA